MTVVVTILTGGVWREALTDPPVQASVRSPRTRIPQSEAGGHWLLSRTSSAGASRLQQLSGTAGDPPQPPTHGKAVKASGVTSKAANGGHFDFNFNRKMNRSLVFDLATGVASRTSQLSAGSEVTCLSRDGVTARV
jgi:hypothetical protein